MIAYLVNRYPAVSHSFIRREIEGVEAAGVPVRRFSIRPPGADLPDAADQVEAERTTVVMNQGKAALIGAFLKRLARHPGRSLSALGLALAMGGIDPRRVVRHIAYLLQASWIAGALGPATHIHAHFGTNPAAVARLVRRLSGVTYSFTVHGPDEFDAPAELDLRGKIADASLVAGISSFGRSQLMRWSRYRDWPKLAVVRCGLDSSFLSVAPEPVPDAPELCCVARLSAQKGLPLLLDAAELLARRGAAFRLTLVGDGEMRGELEAMVQAKALQDHVRFVGSTDAAGVRDHLRAARAMVLPSFAEGLPVVIMEALAMGRPVIVSAIAGTPELVDPSCGWLVPAGDVGAIADAMAEALAATPATLDGMGAVGRERVLAAHDAARNGRALVEALGVAGALPR